jgi:hypothetical protein
MHYVVIASCFVQPEFCEFRIRGMVNLAHVHMASIAMVDMVHGGVMEWNP